jgi:methyl-accepting chemotaxis protein
MTDREGKKKRGIFSPRRFAGNLSIAGKFWFATAILATPLVGLGIFYIGTLRATLWFTATEQRGAALYRPVDQIMASIARHGELDAVAMASGQTASASSDHLLDDAAAQLEALKALDAAEGNAATHPLVADLEQKLAVLKHDKPGSIQESLATQGDVLDAAFALKGQIGSDWHLLGDSEAAANYLIDLALMKIPDMERYLAETRARLADIYVDGQYSPSEGFRIATLTALVGDRIVTAHEELTAAVQAASNRPELAEALGGIPKDWDTATSTWLVQLAGQLRSGHPDAAALKDLLTQSDGLSLSLRALQDQVRNAADTALRLRHTHQAYTAWLALAGSGVAMLIAVLLMAGLTRGIAGAIRRLMRISERITHGNYDNPVDESGVDELSRLFAGMAQMQRQLKKQIEEERAQSIANGRIRSALDNVSGNVMVADAKGDVIYVNKAIEAMLKHAEHDIRKVLPQYSQALGTNLEGLCCGLSGQSMRLAQLTSSLTSEFAVGAHTFKIIANPVLAQDGERVGTVVEWTDRTAEIAVERELQVMLAGVIDGELHKRIAMDGKTGFFETMGRGVNQLAENMADVVSKVKQAAGEVWRGAQEISQGNANLSQRTEQQSASLENTSASMKEMTQTVKRNAENAGQASQRATTARQQAINGGVVVGNAVQAMTDINAASRRIADIIGVIDEIAFQTNLLALNAAVEAARAGDQGRGFAVVASEVRNLAVRSAAAAKEIKALIHDSVNKVQLGSELVAQSGRTLEEIVASIKQVSEIVTEIAAASSAQSNDIEQVNRAVIQMDQMTQQNASMVEEATAASQSMADQARDLNQLMERYRNEPHSRAAAAFSDAAPERDSPVAAERPARVRGLARR